MALPNRGVMKGPPVPSHLPDHGVPTGEPPLAERSAEFACPLGRQRLLDHRTRGVEVERPGRRRDGGRAKHEPDHAGDRDGEDSDCEVMDVSMGHVCECLLFVSSRFRFRFRASIEVTGAVVMGCAGPLDWMYEAFGALGR
jgi:hypothetical protein